MLFAVIKSVADDEVIANFEPDVLDGQVDRSP
jgi:hypothetical protein